jgi:23S rRNA pseudouridine2457 synthase
MPNNNIILIALNKPFQVLCQFQDEKGRRTLADYIPVRDIYAAGRLDYDSEGLVLLTNNGKLQNQISDPRDKIWKTYLVQVEGLFSKEAVDELCKGVMIPEYHTLPAKVKIVDQPSTLWERDPPIRFRKEIPTTWVEIQICEGKKRQVRHMTAAVGFPTLRLIRTAIGPWTLGNLKPGEWEELRIQ